MQREGMAKKILICIAAASLFIFISCNNSSTENESPNRTNGFTSNPKTKEDSLYKEVMDGHDIGMARMQKISKYLSRIKNDLDSVNRLPKRRGNMKYQQALIDLQEQLNYAEYSMNTWMNGFKIDSARGDTGKRIQYLEGEKDKVQKVKEAILGSLKKADSLFTK